MDAFKVMTFNIHHGKGMDRKVDLRRISEVISSSNADIIGLNEVDKHFSKRSNYVDQLQFLAAELNVSYAFSPSITRKSINNEMITHQYGNGILSRFPLVTTNNYFFSYLPRIVEGRSLLEATVEVNGKLVHLYVTHLSLNPFIHRLQSEIILKRIKKPAIILGDWNMKPKSRKWKRLADHYIDVWEEAGVGPGNTYPSLKPKSRLDYMFVSTDIEVVNTEVYDSLPLASDHLPLLSTLLV